MTTIEQVEKLMEKANVSYGEAKAALDGAGGDILEAIISLEREGKLKAPENDSKFTIRLEKNKKQKECGESTIRKFFRWCGKMFTKGNTHLFEVYRKGDLMMAVPVTVLVILLLLAFWVIVPLIVVGLFLGCRYAFNGPDIEKATVNKMMDAAADAAESLKKDINEC